MCCAYIAAALSGSERYRVCPEQATDLSQDMSGQKTPASRMGLATFQPWPSMPFLVRMQLYAVRCG